MLFGLNNHFGNAHLVALAQGFTQQGIYLFTPFQRCRVVRPFQIHKRDLVGVQKSLDLDGLGHLGERGCNFFRGQHHVAPVFVFHSLHDVGACNLFACDLVDALVAHRLHRPLVQPIEIDARTGRGRIQPDWYVHQTETDGTFPHRARGCGRLAVIVCHGQLRGRWVYCDARYSRTLSAELPTAATASLNSISVTPRLLVQSRTS
ncbi:hypothetical protein D3C87_1620850 [compost metagenome]